MVGDETSLIEALSGAHGGAGGKAETAASFDL